MNSQFSADLFITPDRPLREGFMKLDGNSAQVLLVVDDQQKLLGLITDGDLRRGLLRGLQLNDRVSLVMNVKPLTVPNNSPRSDVLILMRRHRIHQIPALDESGRVVALHLIDEIIGIKERSNFVVLMAGGLGMRLRPLTEHTPKPLLKLGNKPIIEHIIDHFKSLGFYRFVLSVNYLAHQFIDYFGDGHSFNCEISYIEEQSKLGTAGALSLWQTKDQNDFIVMNGDILTNLDFARLIDFHTKQRATATIAVRQFSYQVPYGVVQSDEQGMLKSIIEKPMQSFHISGGIYVLNPSILKFLNHNQYRDMPNLLSDVGKNIRIYPIHDYWQDIGTKEEFHLAEQRMLNKNLF